jgi:predicted phage-related endonuclease
MTWGTRLESAIALGVGEDNQWTVKPFKDYVRIPDLKMGASFDFKIDKPAALLEIKNVDAMQFKEKWDIDEDGNIEAPLHIEMQLQYQMLVSGVSEAYIGALIGGNNVKLLKREIDNDITKSIQEKVFEFWESIRKGTPPPPDFTRDAAFVGKLYRSVKAGSVIESTSDDRINTLAHEYRLAQIAEKDAAQKKQAAKAEMLTLIGEANKVKGEGFSISAGMIPAKHYVVNTEPYRDFRVTFKKIKDVTDE